MAVAQELEEKYKQLSVEIEQSDIAVERWNVVNLCECTSMLLMSAFQIWTFRRDLYRQIRLGKDIV